MAFNLRCYLLRSAALTLNLSQVTSALSYSYVRVKQPSVKNKPEINIYCSESFLSTLKLFQQSENAKLFKNLPNVKFGPKVKDIQWIYSKDINIKFKVEKSVDNLEVCISLNKRNDHSGNKLYDLCLSRSKNGKNQTKILSYLETLLTGKSSWGKTYISGSSFDKNKKSSYCINDVNGMKFNRTSPVFSLIKTINSYSSSLNTISLQNRGFKTKRIMELEEKTNTGIFGGFGKNLGGLWFDNSSSKDFKDKSADNATLSKMMEDKELTPAEKQNLKVSFAEGYMAGANAVHKPSSPLSIFFHNFKNFLLILLMTVCLLAFLPINGRRNLFSFQFGHHEEVDPEDVGVTFSDVKGVEEVKEELKEIVEFLRNPNKFSNMGGKLPKGVLLVGPPGTGKTLLARAVAGEANVPFFHASGAEFDEIFVGEGARRVRNLFKSAKAKSPSIIFIDEIDCVGSKRKNTMLHPYANQTINQLLSEMDGFSKNEGVIVIGATNRKGDLDPALLRPGRFDVEVLVPLPDKDGRKEILELYMGKILSKNIDILKLAKATAGCTGADLEAMVNHAAIKAAAEGAPYVTMEYIENAKDKIMIGPERKSAVKSDQENLITAYHEGGHTVVAYFTEGAGSVDKVTIVPKGETFGHTLVIPDTEENYLTKAMFMAKMDILLGGRAAEELIFGANKITANAASDLDKATSIASKMVKHFGMSEKLGLRTLKNSKGELVSVNEYGQVTTDQVDMEVKRLIQESYERAKSVLKKHAKEHKLIAEALMKYKTLNPEDVRAILGDNSSDKGSSPSATIVN